MIFPHFLGDHWNPENKPKEGMGGWRSMTLGKKEPTTRKPGCFKIQSLFHGGVTQL